VEELTVLKATAAFEGELITQKLSIEVGAQFSGKCEMKKTPADDKKQK
jgi:cytoskeletal protein CcmA (bactofilin family)